MHADTDMQLLARLARGFGQLVAKMSPTSGQVHVPTAGAEQRLRKGSGDPNPALNNLEVELADPVTPPLEEAQEEEEDEGEEAEPGERTEAGAVEKAAEPRRISTVAVLHDGHLLMGKRRDNGKWTVPGGHVDEGEDHWDGALREVEEETGIQLDSDDLDPLSDVHVKPANDEYPQELHVQPFQAVLKDWPSTSMKEDPDAEVHRWHWVDISDGLPSEIAENLHVPLERNYLMQHLGRTPDPEPSQLIMLDLGSGTEREDGHVGVDLYPYDDQTEVHDLNLGIPYPDASVVHVHMRNAYHDMDLDDRGGLLEEIARVLCNGGVFTYEGPEELDMPEGMTETEHESGVAGDTAWNKQTFVRLSGAESVAKGGPGSGRKSGGGKHTISFRKPGEENWSHAGERTKKEHAEQVASQLQSRGYETKVEAPEQKTQADHEADFRQTAAGKNGGKFVSGGHTKKEAWGKGNAMRSAGVHSTYITHTSGPKSGPRSNYAVYTHGEHFQHSSVKKSSTVAFERTVEIVRKTKDQQVIYCVVLSPNESDEQEDFVTAEDIEAVAHRFMIESRVIGSEHTKVIKAAPVESYIAPQDLTWDGQNGPQKVRKGSWVIGIKIYDRGEWQKVLDGDYTGVSLSGVGERADMVA